MSKSTVLREEMPPFHRNNKFSSAVGEIVARHYTRPEMEAAIMKGLEKTAQDPANLTLSDLAPYDQMHIGGHPATVHFINHLHLEPGMAVLDIGSGMGGVARYAATEFDTKVTGLDLTPAHKDIATLLSEKVGLINEVQFDTGDALHLPYKDQSFDAAYTVHTAMNIADKKRLYQEVFRVLKPGALFGLYDILAGPAVDDLTYPMPWADSAESSFLATPQEVQAMLSATGFQTLRIECRREFALKMLKKATMESTGVLPDLTPPPIRSSDWGLRMENLLHGVVNNACAPWQIICEKK